MVLPAPHIRAEELLVQVLVFVTDDSRSSQSSGPTLVLQDTPAAVLPRNPRALEWRYFATMQTGDALFERERDRMGLALSRGAVYYGSAVPDHLVDDHLLPQRVRLLQQPVGSQDDD